jgi:hypothetical protein
MIKSINWRGKLITGQFLWLENLSVRLTMFLAENTNLRVWTQTCLKTKFTLQQLGYNPSHVGNILRVNLSMGK